MVIKHQLSNVKPGKHGGQALFSHHISGDKIVHHWDNDMSNSNMKCPFVFSQVERKKFPKFFIYLLITTILFYKKICITQKFGIDSFYLALKT